MFAQALAVLLVEMIHVGICWFLILSLRFVALSIVHAKQAFPKKQLNLIFMHKGVLLVFIKTLGVCLIIGLSV